MANFVYHELECEGLKEKLINAGVICEKTLTSRAHPNGVFFPCVLDYERCDKEEWGKELTKILETGVIDCAKKNSNGTYGVRRDYTPEERAELGFYPVQFSEDGNAMSWLCRWRSNEDVSFYASRALPEETMLLTESYEGEFDGGCYLKNGENVGEYKG